MMYKFVAVIFWLSGLFDKQRPETAVQAAPPPWPCSSPRIGSGNVVWSFRSLLDLGAPQWLGLGGPPMVGTWGPPNGCLHYDLYTVWHSPHVGALHKLSCCHRKRVLERSG